MEKSLIMKQNKKNVKNILFSGKQKWLILVLIIFQLQLVTASEIKDRAEMLVKTEFGSDVSLSFQKVRLDSRISKKIEKTTRQRFFKDFIYVWKVTQGGNPIGYALLDNVKGKVMPITFLVNFNLEGEILSSHVVKYREAIGGEVSNQDWNKQFRGRTAESSFKIGSDIDGISGATISVTSMTKGIRKLTLLSNEIKQKIL